MLKSCFVLVFVAVAAATHVTSGGYNYQTSETKTVYPAQPTTEYHHQQPAIGHQDGIEKQFYHFNAPEEHVVTNPIVKKITQQKVKKNLQVIFIKPPEEKHHQRAVQNLVQQATVQDQTHIYVLQPEHTHTVPKRVQQIQQQTVVHHHKPEVHYVKYHTPAEAQHIQHTIIQQYGGKPSEIVHSGSAPIVNFINSSHKNVPAAVQQFASTNVNREYLAPAASAPASLAVGSNYAKNALPSGIDVAPGTSYIPPNF